jgi:hypothetical protein
MFFQFLTPQRLKRMAAAIQGFEFSSICPFTAQITPLDLVRCHPGILSHFIMSWSYRYSSLYRRDIFLAFRMKAKNFNRLRRIKNRCHYLKVYKVIRPTGS